MDLITVGNGGGRTQGLNYALDTIPLTEDEVDAVSFVCEPNGGANANDTGVAGDELMLSGPDLVLAQYNGVGGYDGWGRPIVNGTYQGFRVTNNFINAFVKADPGFTICYQLQALGANGYLYILTGGGLNLSNIIDGGPAFQNVGANDKWSGLGFRLDGVPTQEPFYFYASVNPADNLSFYGVTSIAHPTKTSDFDGGVAVGTLESSTVPDVISLSQFSILGNTNGTFTTSAACRVKSITYSKKPLIHY